MHHMVCLRRKAAMRTCSSARRRRMCVIAKAGTQLKDVTGVPIAFVFGLCFSNLFGFLVFIVWRVDPLWTLFDALVLH